VTTAPGFVLGEELHACRGTQVFRAHRREDGRAVVLKLFSDPQADGEAIRRCRREFEITRALAGTPGVIGVYDLLDLPGGVAIVAEDIGGVSLDRILERGAFGLARGLEVAIAIAEAIGAIHERRIIHKDINPANIVWNETSGELRIIDFEVASQLNQEQQKFLSPTQLEGTLAYTAPEQTGRINRRLDHRADLYAFGVTLYELLTGALPFPDRAGIEMVHAHIALTPPAPHRISPAVPEAVSRIVMRLLEKMADDRYQSAWGVREDLARCLTALRGCGTIAPFPLATADVPTCLHIPQKLFGRAEELATILATFDRAASGPARLLLVTGAPGVGKSALVREVYKPLTARHGNFVSGKFDQFQRDVPFYPWTLAFHDLCTLLLQEDELVLARWRARIQEALGSLGRVLTDVVPSIELIVGPQPEVPPLAGEQAANRLNYVFGRFIKAISIADNPLVVFIDDWQWADAGSLALLRFVLSGDCEHLLVLGAYRDSEVDASHPLHAVLNEIARAGTEIVTVEIGPLAPPDVQQLVGEALVGAQGLDKLSRLVYEKTLGNAFFLIQLLHDLHDRSILRFERSSSGWTWDTEKMAAASLSDNVLHLMAGRIRSLPEATQDALVHAACIGDRFRLRTLAEILGQPAHHAASALEPALQEGIIVPLGSSYRFARQQDNTAPVLYQFVHDRVRQAAYGLIDPAQRERVHFEIARTWLAESDPQRRARHIFDIANQFNAGRRLIETAAQRRELCDINLAAGQRARLAADPATALNYLRCAVELRETDGWQARPEASAALLLAAADAALLCKRYADMESWLDEYLAHVWAPLARVAALRIRLQAYVAQNRLSEAVDVGLSALRLLGTELSRTPGKARVLLHLARTRLAIRRQSFTDLHGLPAMTDPVRLATMDLLGLLLPPAYWTAPDLLALVVFQMVRETLAHGYSPNAGYGLSWWGITECALLGNIEAGVVFGEFAIELARRHDLKLQQPLFFAGWIVHKYRHPLRESLPLLTQAYAVSLEKGDFEYASYARNNEMQMRFHCGTPLDELLPEMERAHRDLTRFDVGSSLFWHDIWWQTACNLSRGGETPHVLAGPAYDEAANLPQHLRVNDHSTLFLLYCAKLTLASFFGDTAAGLVYAREARARLAAGTGMYAQALFHFHESLLLLAGIAAARGGQRRTGLRRVAANQKRLARWAQHSPANHRHQWCLVEAERLGLAGKPEPAARLFEQAIDLARESGFLHEEALANERAAAHYRREGRERLASFYQRQALRLYDHWGAGGKVASLRGGQGARAAGVIVPAARTSASRSTGTTDTSIGATFDQQALTQASLAISGEIVLDRLVSTLLCLVIEHGGAQRATLILKRGDTLSVEASGTAGERIAIVVGATPIESCPALPRTLIQYVARSGRSAVIDDARQPTPFERDPYFLREQPLSVLCEPILRQGKLVGLLYLENNLMAGAFSSGHLDLLRLIAAQAAISIENARLYGQLEERVAERTRELRASLAEQERLNAELQASSQKLEAAYAQLHEANRQLEARANTDPLTGLANRRHFSERLDYELGRCARHGQPLSLLICDLDNFKRYNDRHGHVAGDRCLQRAAAAIASVFVRATDLVARYGGEEFVVLLPATGADEAAGLGERMRQAVAELAITHAGNDGHAIVTISVGCHTVRPGPETVGDDVIRGADRALYAAKGGGRNRLVAAAPDSGGVSRVSSDSPW